MRRTIFATALVMLVGCQHKVQVEDRDIKTDGGKADVQLGPNHKRFEISNGKGKRLLNVDVFDDGRDIKVDKGPQDIKIRRPDR